MEIQETSTVVRIHMEYPIQCFNHPTQRAGSPPHRPTWWEPLSRYSPVKRWEDPPLIATKAKLLPYRRKFCLDFKNKKFTKINRVEPFPISTYLWGPREKLLENNNILYFFQNYEKNLYLQAIWFISITIPYKRSCRWLDVWVPNYMKDFTQKYANSRKNIFDFILLYGGVFAITLSILNRYDWLMASNLSIELMHVINSMKHIYEK